MYKVMPMFLHLLPCSHRNHVLILCIAVCVEVTDVERGESFTLTLIRHCDSEQKTLTHNIFVSFQYCVVVVTVSDNFTATVSLTETTVNFPPVNSLPPRQ